MPQETFGDIWRHVLVGGEVVLQALSGWRPRIILNILECLGQLSKHLPPPNSRM